jgi:hypothetical protein
MKKLLCLALSVVKVMAFVVQLSLFLEMFLLTPTFPEFPRTESNQML